MSLKLMRIPIPIQNEIEGFGKNFEKKILKKKISESLQFLPGQTQISQKKPS